MSYIIREFRFQDFDNIKAARAVVLLMLLKPALSRLDNFSSFSVMNRFRRYSKPFGAPCFDFHKNRDTLMSGYNIDFSEKSRIIDSHNIVPFTTQKIGSQIFALITEPFVIRHLITSYFQYTRSFCEIT